MSGEGNQLRAFPFIKEIFHFYHRYHRLFLKLFVPSVLLGYVAIKAGLEERTAILRQIPRGSDWSLHSPELIQALLAIQVGYLISWLLYSFSFAAVCVAIAKIDSGEVPTSEECFGPMRSRIGPFLRIAFTLYFLLILAVVIASVLSIGLLRTLERISPRVVVSQAWWIELAFFALAFVVVSRFALAMPAVVLDEYGIREALFRSDELTEKCWGVLTLLLAESVGSSYVANRMEFWLARFIPEVTRPQWWWGSVFLVFQLMVGIAVQPPLFIGWAQLYLTKRHVPNELGGPAVS